MFKGDIITLQKKDTNERVKACIMSNYRPLTGFVMAQEIGGLSVFTREKVRLWRRGGDWWIEIDELDTTGIK